MKIQLIAAVDCQGALGKNGSMAWHVPQELSHFKKLTMSGVIIMGRVTFESIGRPLPGRTSIVISRKPSHALETHDNTYWVPSIDAALALAQKQWPERNVWIGGGATIYEQLLEKATDVHLSCIPLRVDEADVFFPPLDPAVWISIATNEVLDEADKRVLFVYQHYKRKTA